MRFTEEEYQRLQQRRAAWRQSEPQAGNPPAKPPKPRKNDPEHQEQKALIEWCDLQGYPFDRLFAIPNGGGRSKMEAGKLKAEGVRKGVPDLMLPVARGGYHGLYIEMKAMGGAVRPDQVDWHEALRAEGYVVVVAWNWEMARKLMERYVATGDVSGYSDNEIDNDNQDGG